MHVERGVTLIVCAYLLDLHQYRHLNKSTTHYTVLLSREKGRDLTQSYDKNSYTNSNVKRAK